MQIDIQKSTGEVWKEVVEIQPEEGFIPGTKHIG
jgi:hypothetical protein